MDPRFDWVKNVVCTNLEVAPKAFDYMLTEAKNKELLGAFFENDGSLASLCFSTTPMDISFARLVHGGKLSGDGDEPPPEEKKPEAKAVVTALRETAEEKKKPKPSTMPYPAASGRIGVSPKKDCHFAQTVTPLIVCSVQYLARPG